MRIVHIRFCAGATGMSDKTIRNGIAELQDDNPLPSGHQRAPGGGRKRQKPHQQDLVAAIGRAK